MKLSLQTSFARLFSTPHLAEYGLSVHAFLWGIAQLLTMGNSVALGKTGVTVHVMMHTQEIMGLWPFMTGGVGILAVATRNRFFRMASSLMAAPMWALLAAFYLTFNPPFAGSIITYALVGVGELIIWVRVKYRFDRWADLSL